MSVFLFFFFLVRQESPSIKLVGIVCGFESLRGVINLNQGPPLRSLAMCENLSSIESNLCPRCPPLRFWLGLAGG